jgi:hypothetical protein
MNVDRIAYLKKKQFEFQEKLKLKSKIENLELFISNLQQNFNVKITKISFPFCEIASPNKYDLPEKPEYTKFTIYSDESENEIIQIIKNWFIEQKSNKFLIRNGNLIEENDWLEIDSKSLLNNFHIAIIDLNLFHTLIFSPTSKNFLNIFEFENEVVFYKGKIDNKKIKYYC